MAVKLLIVTVPSGPAAEEFESELRELIVRFGGEPRPSVAQTLDDGQADTIIKISAEGGLFEGMFNPETTSLA